jgi:hypothetical protein
MSPSDELAHMGLKITRDTALRFCGARFLTIKLTSP